MRRAHLAGAALLALTLAPPARAQDRNKDPKKPAQVLEASKVLRPGDVVGKLLRSSGNTFTLRLEFDTVELKPGARANSANRQQQNLINQQQKLARLQQQLATARTPNQASNILRQMQQVSNQIQNQATQLALRPQQSPFRVVKQSRDVEVEMSPEVEVRTAFLPYAYDDMGDPKKYTREEIKELKGPDPKKPGYKADVDALKPGQKLRVTLARVVEKKEPKDKDADKKEPEKKDAEKKDDQDKEPAKKDGDKKDAEKKDAEKKEPEKKDPEPKDVEKKEPEKKDPEKKDGEKKETRLEATRILILEEASDAVRPGEKERKKKDQ